MSSSEGRRGRGFLRVGRLLFGGSFFGIALIMVGLIFSGWWSWMPLLIGGSWGGAILWRMPWRRFYMVISFVLPCFFVALIASRGLGVLASGGIYGSDTSKKAYFNIEASLLAGILWLLAGVPHRAYRFQVGQSEEGRTQRTLIGLLAAVASILTGVLIILLHFGGGLLHEASIKTLTAGTIFTVFLIAPIYRSEAEKIWQRGFPGVFSPKPLIRRWQEIAADLDVAFERINSLSFTDRAGFFAGNEAPSANDAQMPRSLQGSNSGSASPSPGNSQRTGPARDSRQVRRKKIRDAKDAQRRASRQVSQSGSASPPQGNSQQGRKQGRGTNNAQGRASGSGDLPRIRKV